MKAEEFLKDYGIEDELTYDNNEGEHLISHLMEAYHKKKMKDLLIVLGGGANAGKTHLAEILENQQEILVIDSLFKEPEPIELKITEMYKGDPYASLKDSYNKQQKEQEKLRRRNHNKRK